MPVPLWAVGRHLTLVQITPGAANSSGIIIPGTTVVLTGIVDELEPEETVTTEEISAITSYRENHVSLMVGARMRVTEILQSPASQINVRGPQLLALKSTFLASGYVSIQWTHGGNTNTFLGLYERMSAPWVGKGKKVITASFLPIDDGTYNWAYA